MRTWLMVLTLTLGLGCAGLGSDWERTYSTQLTEPWQSLSVPADGGRITFSNDQMVTVIYENEALAARLDAWSRAYERAGYSRKDDLSDGPTATRTFTSDGHTLALSVVAANGQTTVTTSKLELQ